MSPSLYYVLFTFEIAQFKLEYVSTGASFYDFQNTTTYVQRQRCNRLDRFFKVEENKLFKICTTLAILARA
jgi:hypothetical protein